MKARLRLVACALLAAVAVTTTGCGSLPFLGSSATPEATSTPSGSATATSSVPATATPSATSTAAPVENTFASEPAPKPADPILTSGDWGYHSAVDLDDAGGGFQIHNVAEQKERYRLIKEQSKSLLSALKKSKGVKKLVSSAGGETDEISYSVTYVDALDSVGVNTPWVTATLRASFPTHGGLKAVDTFVYRLKTHKGLNNTPYVSGTAVGYVDTDGAIGNATHPKFPR
jgi:hypothetical protein